MSCAIGGEPLICMKSGSASNVAGWKLLLSPRWGVTVPLMHVHVYVHVYVHVHVHVHVHLHAYRPSCGSVTHFRLPPG